MRKLLLGLFAVAALMLSFDYARGAVPNEISYQGRLRESGQPVSGQRTMRFNIYTVASGGSPVWNTGDVAVQVSTGVFRYTLSPTGINWNDKDFWIETVVAGETLSPREKISAVAFALKSGDTDTLASRTYDSFVSTGTENQNIAGNKCFLESATFLKNVVVNKTVISQSSITTPSIGVGTIIATGTVSVGTTVITQSSITTTALNTGGKHWEVIYAATVMSPTNILSATVDGNTDKIYKITWNIVNGATTTSLYGIRFNNDAVAASYGWQQLSGTDASPSAARNLAGNTYGFIIGQPFTSENGNVVMGEATVYAVSGKNRVIKYQYGNTIYAFGANVINNIVYGVGSWGNLASNITSINFTTDVATGFGVGTYIMIETLR